MSCNLAKDQTCEIRWSSGVTTATPPVYYGVLAPATPSSAPPLVCVHGGAHTGQCYERTPDGRPGWAVRFAAWGFPVYLPDWPGCGRSAYVPMEDLVGDTVCAGIGGLLDAIDGPVVLLTHSMSGAYGWRLLETHGHKIAALVGVAPGPPGNIQPEPTVLARGADFVELEGGPRTRLPLNAWVAPSEDFVLRKLLGRSTRFPRHALPAYRGTLQATAPRLLYQRRNVGGSQLRISDTRSYKGKPILILTGEFDTDHPREIDGGVAAWLREQGAVVDFWFLSDLGVGGNGHMLMSEENSDTIARMVAGWLGSLPLTSGKRAEPPER